MSTFLSQARSLGRRPIISGPRLTIVPKVAARAPRVPFVVLVVSVLAVGLVGLLLLNTSLQRGAYQVTDLRARASALELRQQTLEMQVASLQEPQRVAEAAVRLGMVSGGNPVFLSLRRDKVIGTATAGVAGNAVDLGVPRRLLDTATHKVPVVAGGDLTSGAVVVTRKPERSGTGQPDPHHEAGADRGGQSHDAGTGATKPADTREGSTARG